jgi:hypothetical protein
MHTFLHVRRCCYPAQHNVTQRSRVAQGPWRNRHQRQLSWDVTMYPRLTGASCLGGTSNTAVLGKVPTQACMRTLFPRHWDPAPRCAPRHAIGLRGRRVCHSVYVARGLYSGWREPAKPQTFDACPVEHALIHPSRLVRELRP